MKIVESRISRKELSELAKERFGNLVKGVVDVERGMLVVGCELHADAEALLLDQGSRQSDLWGINFYVEKSGDEFVEFDSMINVRPSQNNRSRGVEDLHVREKFQRLLKIIRKNENMEPQHASLAAGRWQTFSLPEQMGNIGSEISRMLKAKDDAVRLWAGATRAFELLDLTIGDPRWKGRRREFVRTREALADALGGGTEYGTTLECLDRYFFQFAIAARAGR